MDTGMPKGLTPDSEYLGTQHLRVTITPTSVDRSFLPLPWLGLK